MPSENEKKWNPKNLYTTPEYPEDMRRTEIPEPAGRRKLFVAAMLLTAAAVAAVFILSVLGVIRLPALPQELENGALSGGAAVGGNPPPHGDMPLISEFMANNKESLANADGKYYDWIEIYNPTDHAIDLAGFGLSDNPDKPGKFLFPDFALGSGKFVVVFASGTESSGTEIHADFKLKSGGTLLLTDSDGNEVHRVDYSDLRQDNSYAMDMGDFSKWSMTDKPTPGYPNTDRGYENFRSSR